MTATRHVVVALFAILSAIGAHPGSHQAPSHHGTNLPGSGLQTCCQAIPGLRR